MRLSKNALLELGKFFINLALAILIATFVQPLAKDKLDLSILGIGFIIALISIFFGVALINTSDKL